MIGIDEYRQRCGLFHARRKHVLHLIELYCIYMLLFSKDKRKAVSVVVLFYVFVDMLHLSNCTRCVSENTNARINQVSTSNFYISICIGFVLFISQLLLVLAGIGPNPGPLRLTTNDSGSSSDN